MAVSLAGIGTLLSSLRAHSLAQQVVSHNIMNASTRGFSRQVPTLSAAAPVSYLGFNSLYGVHQVGAGVSLSSVSRIRNEFLDMQIRFELSGRGEREATHDAIEAMRVIYPELNTVPGSGLVTAVETFFDDWAGLAAATVTRDALVDDAKIMADLFRNASSTLLTIQRTLDAGVKESMERINALLEEVASANKGITAAQSVGGVPNDLMDRRDLALSGLSELLRIDVVKLADGSALVVAGNGRELVRGSVASGLVAAINPHESSFANVGLRDARTGTVTDITEEIAGGKMKGQIVSRDVIVAEEILKLDQLAHSMIQQVNLLHRAGYAQDDYATDTDTPFFTGSLARDIAVDAAIDANRDLVVTSRIIGDAANTEQAATIGMLGNLVMNAGAGSSAAVSNMVNLIDPTVSMLDAVGTALNNGGSNSANWLAAPGTASGTLYVNGVAVQWDTGNAAMDSVDDLVGNIHAALGGSVRASFDYSRQKLTLVSDRPLAVWDAAGENLTQALSLQTMVGSLAPMNNGIGVLDRAIDDTVAVSLSDLQYRTTAGAGGTVGVYWDAPAGTQNSVTAGWRAGQSLDEILNDPVTGINAVLLGAGAPFQFTFDPATQKISVEGTNVLPAVQATPISSIRIVDAEGNLGSVLNLEAQPLFGSFRDGLLTRMQSRILGAEALQDQSEAAVDQLQLQWDAVSKVNVDEEKARMLEYLRAYEAAVKALAVLDEALNVLINKMAVTNSGTSSSSVISS